MEYNESGTLTVRTYTAGGALPVAQSVVKVIGVDENNEFIEYSVITDIDGITRKIALPAPIRGYSLSPGSNEPSYAIYDIEITANGFYPKTIKSVAIFSGENAMQEVNMIPITLDKSMELYPRGNLYSTVIENETLES